MVGVNAWERARSVLAFITLSYAAVLCALFFRHGDLTMHLRALSILIVIQAGLYSAQMFRCDTASLALRGTAYGREGKVWSLLVFIATMLVSAWVFTGNLAYVVSGLGLLVLACMFSIVILLYARRVFREYLRGMAKKVRRYLSHSMPMPPLSNSVRPGRPVSMARRINDPGVRHYRQL